MENFEAMKELMEECGISASDDQIKELSDSFITHLELQREMSSYAHVGGEQRCYKCEKYKSQIQQLKQEVEVYQSSVKRRRNCEHVWTERGVVMYE